MFYLLLMGKRKCEIQANYSIHYSTESVSASPTATWCTYLPSATVVAETLRFHWCLSVHGGRCTPPGRHPLPPRGPHQRTVRILLKCILVCFASADRGQGASGARDPRPPPPSPSIEILSFSRSFWPTFLEIIG